MKVGKSLTDLAAEITRRANSKRDFVVRSNSIVMDLNEPVGQGNVVSPILRFPVAAGQREDFAMKPLAHEQLCTHLDMPRKYYDRMLAEKPDLLAINVNTWLQKTPSNEARMLRLLDGNVRAFLSDKFSREMENEDIAKPVLEVLNKIGAEVVSCDITDTRLYIKAVDRKRNAEIQAKYGNKLGDGSHKFLKDVLCASVSVLNSEVGKGSMAVIPSIFKDGCTNLLAIKEQVLRRSHVGGRHSIEGSHGAELSDRTRSLKGAALISELGDVVASAFDETRFKAQVQRMQATTEEKIEGDVPEVIEVTRRILQMTETEARIVQRHLIEGADLSRWGLINAITRTAEDVQDYDRATEFERMGGEVLELSRTEWKQIAEAVAA